VGDPLLVQKLHIVQLRVKNGFSYRVVVIEALKPPIDSLRPFGDRHLVVKQLVEVFDHLVLQGLDLPLFEHLLIRLSCLGLGFQVVVPGGVPPRNPASHEVVAPIVRALSIFVLYPS